MAGGKDPGAKVYSITGDGPFAKDFGLCDQIRRALVSGMPYIAESFDCESNVEFGRFLGIVRRFAIEVQSLQYAALDVGYLNEEQFKTCCEQAGKTKALISRSKNGMPRKN